MALFLDNLINLEWKNVIELNGKIIFHLKGKRWRQDLETLKGRIKDVMNQYYYLDDFDMLWCWCWSAVSTVTVSVIMWLKEELHI